MALASAAASMLALSTLAQAQVRPASPEHIGSALSSCIAATSAEGVDGERLKRDGWQQATASSRGKKIDVPVPMYGKRDNDALILFAPSVSAPPTCVVMAGLESVDQLASTAEDISRALGSQPIKREGNEIYWRRGPLIIQLAATGTRDTPSIRVGVTAVSGNKK